MTVSRRSMLKAFGALATSAPLVSLLRASVSGATPSAAPLRLVCINHGLHVNDAFLSPRAAANAPASMPGSGSTFSLDFDGSVLSPLIPFQSQLLVVRGMNYAGVNTNHSNMLTAFTGIGPDAHYDDNACNDSCSMPSGSNSLDQFLHGRLARAGAFDPMVVRVGYLPGQTDFISYRNGQAQVPQTSPAKVFQTYFSGLSTPDAGSSATNALLARRTAMFGVNASELSALANRLGPVERVKLDQHLTALQGLQQRLLTADAGAPLAGCSAPATANTPESGVDPTDFDHFVELITQAFACDLTRFASVQTFGQRGGFPTSLIPNWSISKGPHDCSHDSHGNLSNSEAQNLALWVKLFYTQAAKLLTALSMVSDPLSPGQTLLDNTVVVMAGEHGATPCIWNNNEYEQAQQHSFYDIPFVIAGGCGGQFQMGRIVEATPRQGTPDAEGMYSGNLTNDAVYAGVPHNAALAAVVNAFEAQQARYDPSHVAAPVTQFGHYGPADGAGPLSL